MKSTFRIFIAMTIGLFLVGVTIPSQAGVTSKVKKTAKKTASKAKDTAKKGAEKTNDTVHKGADKAKDTAQKGAEKTNDTVHKGADKGKERVKITGQQAKGMTDSIGGTFKDIMK